MSDLAPPPKEMPDLGRVILPSRAFYLSWQHQTLPARLAAIDDAEAHYLSLNEGDSSPMREMALAGVVGESIQPLEDLSYLATAADQPYQGIANYVRATTWNRFTANNFWQEASKWDDERLDVFAGFAGRDPETGDVYSVIEGLRNFGLSFTDEQLEALHAAREATLNRLRRLLLALGDAWKQFSPYYLAYKHGGLTINRHDVAFVDDQVETIEDATPRYEPSLAVWTRTGRKRELHAVFNLEPRQVNDYAADAGRRAIELCRTFVISRMRNIEALEFSESGEVAGLRPTQLPWTIWLRESDLEQRFWELIGQGPRLEWISNDE